MTAATTSWLDALKVGEKVVIQDGWYGSRGAIIQRITPTQLVVGGMRFHRKTGRQMTSRSPRQVLHPWSAAWEVARAAEEAHAVLVNDVVTAWKQLARADFTAASDEALRDLRSLLLALGGDHE